jgi:hypothetical protein
MTLIHKTCRYENPTHDMQIRVSDTGYRGGYRGYIIYIYIYILQTTNTKMKFRHNDPNFLEIRIFNTQNRSLEVRTINCSFLIESFDVSKCIA